jgi:hypothetical protein
MGVHLSDDEISEKVRKSLITEIIKSAERFFQWSLLLDVSHEKI